jgi:hypothetical protein
LLLFRRQPSHSLKEILETVRGLCQNQQPAVSIIGFFPAVWYLSGNEKTHTLSEPVNLSSYFKHKASSQHPEPLLLTVVQVQGYGETGRDPTLE